jgi:membrane-associated protease RseP (regulator of RpoE activity)
VTDTISNPTEPSVVEPEGEIAGGGWRLAAIVGIVVGLGIITKASVLIVVLALVIMIFLHELGHYLTAKWSGMKVTEFFIGFGPKLWSYRRGETEYGLKAVPAGAYVRIIGMNNLEEVSPADEPRTYRQQSFPKRLLVVSAGSMMHFLQAFVLIIVLFSVVGVPGGTDLSKRLGGEEAGDDDWVVGSVVAGSAAAAAGVEPGDDIVSIDGEPITGWDDVGTVVSTRPNETVDVVVLRDGEEQTVEATLGENPERPDRGFLGIGAGLDMPNVTVGPLRAVGEAGSFTVASMGDAVGALGAFFTGGIGGFADQVANGGNPTAEPGGADDPEVETHGRVASEGDEDRLLSIYGAARIGVDLTDRGFADFLLFLVSINIFIGIFNMVPLLPLDGGHAAIAIYERIRSFGGRRYMADVSRLLPLTYAFVMLLLLLGVSSLYLDIVDPIGVG